jgi:hypothetical protein
LAVEGVTDAAHDVAKGANGAIWTILGARFAGVSNQPAAPVKKIIPAHVNPNRLAAPPTIISLRFIYILITGPLISAATRQMRHSPL